MKAGIGVGVVTACVFPGFFFFFYRGEGVIRIIGGRKLKWAKWEISDDSILFKIQGN